MALLLNYEIFHTHCRLTTFLIWGSRWWRLENVWRRQRLTSGEIYKTHSTSQNDATNENIYHRVQINLFDKEFLDFFCTLYWRIRIIFFFYPFCALQIPILPFILRKISVDLAFKGRRHRNVKLLGSVYCEKTEIIFTITNTVACTLPPPHQQPLVDYYLSLPVYTQIHFVVFRFLTEIAAWELESRVHWKPRQDRSCVLFSNIWY